MTDSFNYIWKFWNFWKLNKEIKWGWKIYKAKYANMSSYHINISQMFGIKLVCIIYSYICIYIIRISQHPGLLKFSRQKLEGYSPRCLSMWIWIMTKNVELNYRRVCWSLWNFENKPWGKVFYNDTLFLANPVMLLSKLY